MDVDEIISASILEKMSRMIRGVLSAFGRKLSGSDSIRVRAKVGEGQDVTTLPVNAKKAFGH